MSIFSLSGGFLFIFILSYFRWQNFFFRFYPLQEVSFSGFIPFRNYPVQKLFYSEWILFRNYPYQELFYSDWILFQEPSFSGISHYRKCPFQDFVYAENILLFFFRQACWKLPDRPQGVQLTTPMPRCHTQICLPGNLSGHWGDRPDIDSCCFSLLELAHLKWKKNRCTFLDHI